MIRTSSNLGLKLGAFVAATSLMLAGGAAVASASFAAPNDNGNGGASQTKPKPNANPNNPQKNDPAATTGTDNNTTDKDGKPEFGPSGSKNDAFDPTRKVYVCHADANNGTAANAAKGSGANNLGQGTGGNTGKGFSIIYISFSAWLSNHDRLHENDRYFDTREGAEGYCGGGGDTYDFWQCKAGVAGETVSLNDQTSSTPPAGWFSAPAPTGDALAAACPGGDTYDFWQCKAGVAGETVSLNDQTSSTPPAGWFPVPAPTGVALATACPGTDPVPATMEAELCQVNGNAYAYGKLSASGSGVDLTAATADATTKLVASLKAYGDANPKAIIKPFGGYSLNWTEGAGQTIFGDNCKLPDGETVQSVNLAAPATVAGPAAGKPAPGKVQTPASATLPGAVNAGGGSSAPTIPMWALAMMVIGALGAAASGAQILGSRK